MSFFQLFSFPLCSNITFSSSPTFLFHTWHFFSWKHFFTFLNQPIFFFSIIFFSVIPRFKCIYVFPEHFFSHLFHPNVFSWFLTWHILIHTFFFLCHCFFTWKISHLSESHMKERKSVSTVKRKSLTRNCSTFFPPHKKELTLTHCFLLRFTFET